MTQAKGIIPRGDDAAMNSPQAEGYYIYVTLDSALTRDQVITFLTDAKVALDALVEEVDGQDVADVVVGLGPRFFGTAGAPRFGTPLQIPVGFADPPPVPGTPLEAELVFYVLALEEARVSQFISSLWELRPAVSSLNMDRGFQRTDKTEVFGFKDGVRNVRSVGRFQVVFIHEDDQPEEPAGCIGGSYMSFLRILQKPDALKAHDIAAQEQIIGRRKDGTRVDLPEGFDPHDEADMPPGEPPAFASHVRKVGPRGTHDDVQIFRRGLPFVDIVDGQVRVGLNFVSFQASLDQFDVVLNDWMLNPNFPPQGGSPGVDKLFDPNLGIATIEKSGLFFVPPHDERFIGASLFNEPPGRGRPKAGQVSIRKKVVDPSDANARFERGGFTFQLIDAAGSVVSSFSTDSKGHARSDEVPLGTYTLHEVPPDPSTKPSTQGAEDQPITLDRKHVVVPVTNTVTSPGSGYGSR